MRVINSNLTFNIYLLFVKKIFFNFLDSCVQNLQTFIYFFKIPIFLPLFFKIFCLLFIFLKLVHAFYL